MNKELIKTYFEEFKHWLSGGNIQAFYKKDDEPKWITDEECIQYEGYDNFTHILYISKDLNKKALKQVLRHEITHAFIYSHNILLTPKEEETVVEIVTNYGQQINKIANRAYKQIKEGKY